MKPDNTIRNELKAMGSILASMPGTTPYEVPEGYFPENARRIQEALQYEQDLTLPYGKEMPYTLPEGYFDTLPQQIFAKIHQSGSAEIRDNKRSERTQAEPFILPAAATPFHTPAGYFETLTGNIMNAVSMEEADNASKREQIPVQDTPRGLSIPFPLWKNIKWAAAALLVISLGLGFYRYSLPVPASIEQQLAMVSNDSIKAYVLQHIDEFETDDLAMLGGKMALNMSLQQRIIEDAASKEDIIQYLDENGWDNQVY